MLCHSQAIKITQQTRKMNTKDKDTDKGTTVTKTTLYSVVK